MAKMTTRARQADKVKKTSAMPAQAKRSDDSLERLQTEQAERLAPKRDAGNTGIPLPLKEEFEAKSGFSFDDVRVHYNSDKPAQLQALAYTQGNEVHIGPGQEQHLRHELGHVVQQKAGMVRPTGEVGGLPLNDDAGLEHAADAGILPLFARFTPGSQIVQMLDIMKHEGDNNPQDNDVVYCKDQLSLPDRSSLATMTKWGALGIYKLSNSLLAQLKTIEYAYPKIGDNILDVNSAFQDAVGKIDTRNDPINEYTEAAFYEHAESGGGGGYNPHLNAITICNNLYSRRTLLHELGHFKQYLDPQIMAEQGQDTLRNTDQKIQLFDMHNIILHENYHDDLHEPIASDPTLQNRYRQSGNRWIRTFYTGERQNAIATQRTPHIAVGNAQDLHTRLANEILAGLQNPIYNQEIREIIYTQLIRDCPDYFYIPHA